MAAVFFALPIVAVVNLAFWLVMRIRLMRVDSARDSDDVLGAYAALFPNSVLPRCVRFASWTLIVCATMILCATMMLKAFGK
jgi:hypothetical protein